MGESAEQGFIPDNNFCFYRPLPFKNRIMAKKLLLLDIGTDSVYYLVARKFKEKMYVQQWGMESLQHDQLDRYRSLEVALKLIREKVYRSGMAVQVSFFSPDINIRQLVVPHLKDAEIEKIILYKNKSDLPSFTEDTLWKYEVLEKFNEGNTPKVRVLVLVVPREVVKMHMDILQQAGLAPEVLLPRPFAFRGAYQELIHHKEVDILIDISSDTTQICFMKNGNLTLVRNFAVGISNLQKAIANGNGNASKEEKAERESSDTGEVNASDLKARLHQKVNKLKSHHNPLLQELLSEILRSVEFFKSKNSGHEISHVYLSGEGVKLSSLFTYLKYNLPYPVDWLSLQFSEENTIHTQYSEYAGSLGIGLASAGRMNLVPKEIRSRQLFRNLSFFALLVMLAAGGLMALHTFSLKKQISILQSRTLETEQAYLNLDPLEQQYQDELKIVKETQNEKNLLLAPVKPVPELIEVMKLFSNELPEQVRLNRLQFNTIPPAAGKKNIAAEQQNSRYRIKAIGIIKGDYLVADVNLINFIQHLKHLNYFRDIRLVSKSKQADKQRFEFEIECFL
ncbi:MAG: pilus assembly protein PilM [Calditrichia bacterium]